ncbi:MAG TPA: class I SAM-dependent methyltransferase [Candidatus Dormibacteraeota bacterium]|nr:class I SAM-dependent methyltransferase [Candidatus Dormibacteraeota bacterium]
MTAATSGTTTSPGVHLDPHRHLGDYGLDGDFDHVPARVQMVGLGAFALAMTGVAVRGLSRGRPRQGAVAAALGGFVIGTAASYAYATRVGKLAVWADLLTDLELRGDERLLDVGCGRGAVLLTAAKLLPRGRAVGIDLWRPDQTDNSMDATLRNAALEGVAERVEVETADMTRLPFADASFDVVVSSLAVHNVPGPEGRRTAMLEAARVLRPGGRLLIADLAFTRHYAAWLRELGLADVGRRNLGWRTWFGGPWFPVHLVTAVR